MKAIVTGIVVLRILSSVRRFGASPRYASTAGGMACGPQV
jgi:hypothetical protein